MRKAFIISTAITAILCLVFILNAPSVVSQDITPTTSAFMPNVANAFSSEATVTASATPRVDPGPSNYIGIRELSGHSDPEYVDIITQLETETERDLTGWYLVSVIGGEIFHFPDGFTLPAKGFVQIESGPSAISNPPLQLLWTNDTIWSDSGDKVILYDSDDKAVYSTCYGIGCALP